MRRHITYSEEKKPTCSYFLLKHFLDSNENKLLEEGTKAGFEVLSKANIAHNYFVEINANLPVNIKSFMRRRTSCVTHHSLRKKHSLKSV